MAVHTTKMLSLVFVLSACTGDISALPEATGPNPIRPGGPLEPEEPLEDPRAANCVDRSADVALAPLRRLSRAEFEASLRTLFPAAAVDEIGVWLSAIPADSTSSSPGEFVPGTTQGGVEASMDVAFQLAGTVARNDDYLRAIAPPCLLNDANADCVESFLRDFGARVLRRPLEESEVEDYRDAYFGDEGIDEARDRVEVLLATLLSVPEFTHHVVRAAGDERSVLDPFALASRISFAVRGAGPDGALLEAASNGELSIAAARAEHARRLLDSPEGRTHVRALFARWLGLHAQYSPQLAADLAGVEVDGLYEELRGEALDFVEHIVFDERGGFGELMTSKAVFPSTERLAAILGTESSEGAVETFGRRAGLLTRPVSMISNNPRTSPIRRGLFIWERFLCHEFVLPEGLDTDQIASEQLAGFDADGATSRARAEVMTGLPECVTCHAQINPPGFALAHFGPLGEEWDSHEFVYEGGDVTRELSLDGDANVEGLFVDESSHIVEGAEEMADLIASSEQGRSCAALQVFRTTHLREPLGADACHVQDILVAIDEGTPIFDILVLNASQESTFVPGVSR